MASSVAKHALPVPDGASAVFQTTSCPTLHGRRSLVREATPDKPKFVPVAGVDRVTGHTSKHARGTYKGVDAKKLTNH